MPNGPFEKRIATVVAKKLKRHGFEQLGPRSFGRRRDDLLQLVEFQLGARGRLGRFTINCGWRHLLYERRAGVYDCSEGIGDLAGEHRDLWFRKGGAEFDEAVALLLNFGVPFLDEHDMIEKILRAHERSGNEGPMLLGVDSGWRALNVGLCHLHLGELALAKRFLSKAAKIKNRGLYNPGAIAIEALAKLKGGAAVPEQEPSPSTAPKARKATRKPAGRAKAAKAVGARRRGKQTQFGYRVWKGEQMPNGPFEKRIATVVAKRLKKHGFEILGPRRLCRRRDGLLQVVEFQLGQTGLKGKFTINCCLVLMLYDRDTCVYDCSERIGHLAGQRDLWFRKGGAEFDRAVELLLEFGIPFLDDHDTVEKILRGHAKRKYEGPKLLGESPEAVKLNLGLCHRHLGNTPLAKRFLSQAAKAAPRKGGIDRGAIARAALAEISPETAAEKRRAPEKRKSAKKATARPAKARTRS